MSDLTLIACFCCIGLLHAFVPPRPHLYSYRTTSIASATPSRSRSSLPLSPFDNLIGGLFGNDDEKEKKPEPNDFDSTIKDNVPVEDDEISLSSFQKELTKRQQQVEEANPDPTEDEEEFNGYDLRDIIYTKYGECFDVQFQRVDSYGVRAVYLVSFCSHGTANFMRTFTSSQF